MKPVIWHLSPEMKPDNGTREAKVDEAETEGAWEVRGLDQVWNYYFCNTRGTGRLNLIDWGC